MPSASTQKQRLRLQVKTMPSASTQKQVKTMPSASSKMTNFNKMSKSRIYSIVQENTT
jgi:hypothetical protein